MSDPIKILLHVPVWQREATVRRHMENVERLISFDPSRYKITPFYVVSEDWAVEMCDEFGFDYHRCENSPLGKKMNEGLAQFINSDFDWMIGLGSDDFVEPSFLDEYLPYFETRQIFGLKEVHLINEANGMVKHVIVDQGCFGALRAIRWDLLTSASFDGERFIGIWENNQHKVLDYVSSINIHRRTGQFVYPVHIEAKLFDVKGDLNINGFDKCAGERVRVGIDEIPKELHYLYEK